MNPKRGFVFYFDNYPALTALSPEQRGWLLTVLMVYADRVWREPEVTLEEVMESFPMLSSETRLACSFMGASILRDTQKWLNRQRSGIASRSGGKPGPSAEEKASAGRREAEDMERARRLMERFQEEENRTHNAPC